MATRQLMSLGIGVVLLALACQPAAPSRPPGGAPANPAAGTTASGPSSQTSAAQAPANRGGPTRVVIGVTETIESQNPYADSISLGYGIWCEVLGCLVSMDPQTNTYKPELAESWEVENPTTWVFHLRKD